MTTTVSAAIDNTADMISWHKLIEHHGKQGALTTSISSDVSHQQLPRFLSYGASSTALDERETDPG
jgi:hypothetical protein